MRLLENVFNWYLPKKRNPGQGHREGEVSQGFFHKKPAFWGQTRPSEPSPV